MVGLHRGTGGGDRSGQSGELMSTMDLFFNLETSFLVEYDVYFFTVSVRTR